MQTVPVLRPSVRRSVSCRPAGGLAHLDVVGPQDDPAAETVTQVDDGHTAAEADDVGEGSAQRDDQDLEKNTRDVSARIAPPVQIVGSRDVEAFRTDVCIHHSRYISGRS